MRFLSKSWHTKKTTQKVRTTLNLGFYKRMSIKETWDKQPGAAAEMRIKVAGKKGLFGTTYNLSLDNGFRDVGFWKSLWIDGVLPGRDGYTGTAEFVAREANAFVANSMKTRPEAARQYMMMANALEFGFLKVAQTIGDKTIQRAKLGLNTYELD